MISGMGIGGGAILIPSLVIFLAIEQHTAQSVNLLFFIPTAIVALFIHIKNKSVNIKPALIIVVSGVIGAIAGAYMATSLSSEFLKKVFGVFLLVMGIYEISGAKKGIIRGCERD